MRRRWPPAITRATPASSEFAAAAVRGEQRRRVARAADRERRLLGELAERIGGGFVQQTSLLAPGQPRRLQHGRDREAWTGAAAAPGGPRRPQHDRPRRLHRLGERLAAGSGRRGSADRAGPRHRHAAARRQRARRQLPDAGHDDRNIAQQNWIADVATRVLLPMFKARGKPFVLVYWSRDPDGSQHNQGDSFAACSPASTAPRRSPASATPTTTCAGCARRWSRSTSPRPPTSSWLPTTGSRPCRARARPARRPGALCRRRAGHLPPGFLAIDLAEALGLPLWDPSRKNAECAGESTPTARRPGSRPGGARGDRRGRRRHGADLSAGADTVHARPGTVAALAGAGLCERHLRGRCARQRFPARCR